MCMKDESSIYRVSQSFPLKKKFVKYEINVYFSFRKVKSIMTNYFPFLQQKVKSKYKKKIMGKNPNRRFQQNQKNFGF